MCADLHRSMPWFTMSSKDVALRLSRCNHKSTWFMGMVHCFYKLKFWWYCYVHLHVEGPGVPGYLVSWESNFIQSRNEKAHTVVPVILLFPGKHWLYIVNHLSPFKTAKWLTHMVWNSSIVFNNCLPLKIKSSNMKNDSTSMLPSISIFFLLPWMCKYVIYY